MLNATNSFKYISKTFKNGHWIYRYADKKSDSGATKNGRRRYHFTKKNYVGASDNYLRQLKTDPRYVAARQKAERNAMIEEYRNRAKPKNPTARSPKAQQHIAWVKDTPRRNAQNTGDELTKLYANRMGYNMVTKSNFSLAKTLVGLPQSKPSKTLVKRPTYSKAKAKGWHIIRNKTRVGVANAKRKISKLLRRK